MQARENGMMHVYQQNEYRFCALNISIKLERKVPQGKIFPSFQEKTLEFFHLVQLRAY